MKRDINLVVISDLHLGSYKCRAKELLQYLKSINPNILVLNGDIFDATQFDKSFFPKAHLQIISRILSLSTKGTKVYYVCGNHDGIMKKFVNFNIGNIYISNKLELKINGKLHLFFHGNLFDFSTNLSRSVMKMSRRFYDFFSILDDKMEQIGHFFGFSTKSFSDKIGLKNKKSYRLIEQFEKAAMNVAAELFADYIICGHTHQPKIREENIGKYAITYLNAGDWVENLTALEYNFGKWSLYHYDKFDFPQPNPKLNIMQKEDDDIFESSDSMNKNAVHSYFSAFITQSEPSEK